MDVDAYTDSGALYKGSSLAEDGLRSAQSQVSLFPTHLQVRWGDLVMQADDLDPGRQTREADGRAGKAGGILRSGILSARVGCWALVRIVHPGVLG